MYDTLSRLDGEGVGGKSDILCLLQRLGLQEGEATVPDGSDGGVVGVASWL